MFPQTSETLNHTPAHLLYGQRIVGLPYPIMQGDETEDPDLENPSVIRARVNAQATLLQNFWNRWKKEYLTGLVCWYLMIYLDRVKWRLANVEDVITGENGLIRVANIRMSTGKSNRPVTKLYPLEVTASEQTLLPKISSQHPLDKCAPTNKQSESVPAKGRPIRRAALRGRELVQEWTKSLRAPPEDVENSDDND